MIEMKLSLVREANCYRLLRGDNAFRTGTKGSL